MFSAIVPALEKKKCGQFTTLLILVHVFVRR